MKLSIFSWNHASSSAKQLASALNCKRIKHEGSHFRHTNSKLVINWGSSSLSHRVDPRRTLNHPSCVEMAANKLKTLTTLTAHDIPCVASTSSFEEARSWLAEGNTIYQRLIVSGHSGAGIIIVKPGENLTYAPLYTKKFKTKREYRVHVGVKDNVGSVIHIQQKRLRQDAPVDRIKGIRNHSNGWIFACNDVDPLHQEAQQVAIDGVMALELDFGAVDLLVDRNNNAVICEINTAPGLEGTTINKYVEFFNKFKE